MDATNSPKPEVRAMSSKVLLAVAVVLVAAVLWIGLRYARHSAAPIAAPEPERAPSTQGPTELDQPDAVSIDSAESSAAVAEVAATQAPASTRANAAGTIILYGTIVNPAEATEDDETSYVRVTDRFGQSVQVRASSEGAYSISGLAPGHYWLGAGSGMTAIAHAELDLALAESPKRFDILLIEPHAVLVKVVDLDGKPVLTPGLLAVATSSEPDEWFDEMTDRCLNLGGLGGFRDGRYTGGPLPQGFLGRILLEQPPPVMVSLLYCQRVLATQRLERGQTEVVFPNDSNAVRPSTVRVRFVDEHGAAASISMVDLDGDSSNRLVVAGDAWIARDVMPGKYELRPRGKGLEMRTVPVVVEPGSDTDLGTVVLAPDRSVSGSVRVAADENLSWISVRCDACDAEGATRGSSGTIYGYGLKPDGSFSIPNLSRGTYLLQVSERYPKHGKWARIIDTRGGSVTNVDIHLVGGVTVGLRPSKRDAPAVHFRILDVDRTPLVSSRLYDDSPRPILLAPGRYDVEVVEPERTRRHITLVSQPVELALP
jgi:hypothetical protein